MAAVLDKCQISERDSTHLLIAFLEAASLDPNKYIINRTSIRESRANYREHYERKVTEAFHTLNVKFVSIHWDTKLLESAIGKRVDRLSIIATAPGVEQLLGVPGISNGTGLEISSEVFDTIENWNLSDRVQAFVFDTTASNTGRLNGACTLLEQRLGRNILFLGCRHHIFEIVLNAVFNKLKVTPMSGPDIPLFKRFKKNGTK